MFLFRDLKDFIKSQNLKIIIAADAEPRVSKLVKGKSVLTIPAGGVAVAFDPIACASNAVFVGRGKAEEENLSGSKRFTVEDPRGNYTLNRIFISKEEMDDYYYGFSNQTLWPMCHVTFERPEFKDNWYEGFKKVNQKFAKAIKEEIKGKTFIWLNDYQLSLVPKYIGKQKDVTIGMFWHIPWPTWEVFRILPQKKEILESLLSCDFIAFHRGYQARNFINTIKREFEARIDLETNRVFFNGNVTTVKNLPMGIDTDLLSSHLEKDKEDTFLAKIVKKMMHLDINDNSDKRFDTLFKKNKIILGVDRLDYTKGLRLRLLALDKFFEKNKNYIGKVSYLGILAPSREKIYSYGLLKKEIRDLEKEINNKYETKNWKPINIIYEVFPRDEILKFYKNASLCLVTPLDDGMNLVSKEFVIATSFSADPGMIVLSQFAGSSIDLTRALIVNPYNIEEVANAIKRGLEMNVKEKVERIQTMKETLEERNIYEWTQNFIKSTIQANKQYD
ncbi:trehalose-6-phosphate synthase [Candidatus Microgenomates bacterium]|nr:MAG: trehalose-6-phosphate synthase [Candidatus Microgenomates bacterium]